MSTSYLNIFGGDIIYPSYISYLPIGTVASPFSADRTLAWPSDFQNGLNVVSAIMDVTPSAGGLSLTLPDATQTSVGQSFLLNNIGAFTFTLKRGDGSTLLGPVPVGSANYFYLRTNTTVAGGWASSPWGAGGPQITSVGLNPSGTSDNITVSPAYLAPGNPIISAGTFTLGLGKDLGALAGFGSGLGIAVRTNSAPQTWALRVLSGTANQVDIIANPAGTAGNPTIALASNITGIQSITAGNIKIGGAGANANDIAATNASGDLNFETTFPTTGDANFTMRLNVHPFSVTGGTINFFNPADSFSLSLAGGNMSADIPLTLPTVAPTLNQVLSCISAGPPGQLGWANVTTFGGSSTINSIAKFTDASGTIGSSGVLIDGLNNITGALSITLPQLALSTNIISTLVLNEALILSPNGTGGVQFPSGSAAIPGISFTGVPTTGIFTSGGSTIEFSVLGDKQTQISSTPLAVNYLQFTGGITGSSVKINSIGGDANVPISLLPAGTGGVQFPLGSTAIPSISFETASTTGIYSPIGNTVCFSVLGQRQFQISSTPLAVNFPQVTGSTIGNPVQINAQGTDANISIQITPAGTGSLLNAVGAAATPSYSFTGDTDTGMYRPAANQIAWSTNATQKMVLDASGTLSLTGSLLNAVGAAATPSYSFTGDTGTGMYRSAANTIAWSTSATQKMLLDTSGNLGLGVSTFGAAATNTLSMIVGTNTAVSVANSTQVFATSVVVIPASAGTTCIGWTGAGTGGVSVVSPGGGSFIRTIAISINGTVYYIPAKLTNN